MRLDRIVTLALWRQQRWLTSGQHRSRLPILMYHSISDERQRTAAYFQTVTHPSVFAEQMQLLKSGGYVGVTLTDGLNWLQSSRPEFPRPVVITFDDGLRDFMTAAVAVLEQYGFKATMYLPTGFIDYQRRQLNNRDCLTWSEIADLHSAGFEFGSHTVTHPHLVRLGWTDIRVELVQSKKTIEEHLQSEVTAFAYPYAFPQERTDFVERFSRILRDVGYRTCATTKIGRMAIEDDWLCLRRLPVNSWDDASLLSAKLEGAYDWLAAAQATLKQIKSFTTG